MNIRTITTFAALLLVLSLNGNDEAKFPSGATDLVPDQRFDKFKEAKMETVSFTVNLEDIKWEEEPGAELSVFQVDYPAEIMELRIENEKLKQEISELDRRLSVLEKLLGPRSEPVGATGQRR
ncbi:hypothetical protein [Coraliomargarita parva]|uniref:hypothetical protein n=1 Tax=Coraliomargarita parva TaxID=3014050 RepID=UPI0022B2D8A7|nr:hypothetical protein [Coraliomargarita parva]